MNSYTLLTEKVTSGDWVIVEGVPYTFLGKITIRIGEHESTAFIENTKAMIRCPRLERGAQPVRVDGARIGTVEVV